MVRDGAKKRLLTMRNRNRKPSHDRGYRCEADRAGPQTLQRRLAVLLGLALDRDAAADGGHGSRLRRPLQCRQVEPDQRAHRAQCAGKDLAYAGPHPGTDFLRGPRKGRLPAGRYARLRLRLRAEGEGCVLDCLDSQIPAGPQHAGAGLCADRCPAWLQGGRSRRAEDPRQIGRELSARADQGRPGQACRTGNLRLTTAAALAKHPAAFPDVLATSSRSGAGMPELRAAMVRLLGERRR